jgi:hypothetical protein
MEQHVIANKATASDTEADRNVAIHLGRFMIRSPYIRQSLETYRAIKTLEQKNQSK